MAKLAENLPKEKVDQMYKNAGRNNGTRIPGRQFIRKENEAFDVSKSFPTHVNRVTLLCRNNAEFKRLLALSLIQLHKEKGDVPEGSKAYVKFNFNKYLLRVDGLGREYSFKSKDFVTCYLAAVVALDKYMQEIIADYINNEVEFNIEEDDVAKANDIAGKINVVPAVIETVEE